MWAQHWLIRISVDREDDVMLPTPSFKGKKQDIPCLAFKEMATVSVQPISFHQQPPGLTSGWVCASRWSSWMSSLPCILEVVSHNYIKRERLLLQRAQRKIEGFGSEHTFKSRRRREAQGSTLQLYWVWLWSKCKDGSEKEIMLPELLLRKSNTCKTFGSLSKLSALVKISF